MWDFLVKNKSVWSSATWTDRYSTGMKTNSHWRTNLQIPVRNYYYYCLCVFNSYNSPTYLQIIFKIRHNKGFDSTHSVLLTDASKFEQQIFKICTSTNPENGSVPDTRTTPSNNNMALFAWGSLLIDTKWNRFFRCERSAFVPFSPVVTHSIAAKKFPCGPKSIFPVEGHYERDVCKTVQLHHEFLIEFMFLQT